MKGKIPGLLLDHLDLLTQLDRSLPVLDLACGRGQNGLLVASSGMTVVFADRSVESLSLVDRQLTASALSGYTWQLDLEQAGVNPLAGQYYAAIMVFHYLHRPLFPALKEAVIPGGLIIYQTFTIQQRQFGRPGNPDFLLQSGELVNEFSDWETIHHFEGIRPEPDRGIAQLVARKPV